MLKCQFQVPKRGNLRALVLSNAWPILIFLNTKPSKVFVKKNFMALGYQISRFCKINAPTWYQFSFLNVSLVTNFGNNCLIFISVEFQNV